jgi:hypothetical protein
MLVPFANIRVQQAWLFSRHVRFSDGFLKPDRASLVDLPMFPVQAFHKRARGKTMMRMPGPGHPGALFDVRPMAK